ncbi:hypothetical protein EN873_27630 [bacterium M00.F.Ca.ET.230.01.1.1]|nr:hypothetical protein EN873_27630 [bacterium M00.F.Ca.ET.230.01.1.1]
MSIIVCKIDGVWQEWHGYRTVQKMVSTYTAVYGDGRQVETACDPYPVEVQIDGDRLQQIYDQGTWSLEEVEAVGAKVALPFAAPEGKQTFGSPSYVEADETVQQVYQVEDIPPPPVPPTAEEKVSAMLANFDISIRDLKSVLGLGV